MLTSVEMTSVSNFTLWCELGFREENVIVYPLTFWTLLFYFFFPIQQDITFFSLKKAIPLLLITDTSFFFFGFDCVHVWVPIIILPIVMTYVQNKTQQKKKRIQN